jgi:hypothetical protein
MGPAVFWKCAVAATVVACGGPPWQVVISVPDSPVAATLSQGSIYVVTDRCRLLQVALPGGALTELQPPRSAGRASGYLALAGRELVSACGDPSALFSTVTAVSIDGPPARDLEGVVGGVLNLASDGASAYWIGDVPDALSGPPREIRAISLAGGASRSVLRPEGLSSIVVNAKWPLAVDDGFVYYFVNVPSPRLMRAPKGGGAEALVAQTPSLYAGPIVDGPDLVWAELSQVLRSPKSGGQLSLVGRVPGLVESLMGGGPTWFVSSLVPDPGPQDGPIGESVREYLLNGAGAAEITPNAGLFLGVDGSDFYWIRFERDGARIVRTAAR